ncbi:hypothetical protein V7183_04810 [Bacillus sp. JJ1127]|uniref:hypothetical protein n=1 Tax=Bacillus sp. JJ1127 TaxID=3122952 RepID=UPI003000656A
MEEVLIHVYEGNHTLYTTTGRIISDGIFEEDKPEESNSNEEDDENTVKGGDC